MRLKLTGMAEVINNTQNLQINTGTDITEFPKHACRIMLKDNVLTVRDVADDRTETVTLDFASVTSPVAASNTALAGILIGYLSTGVGVTPSGGDSSTAGAPTTVTVLTANIQLLAATSRVSATITNFGSTRVHIGIGSTATLTSAEYVDPGEIWLTEKALVINAISASGSNSVSITEYTS